MTWTDLKTLLKVNALNLQTVNSAYDGDVYKNWNTSNVKYGSINVGLDSVENTENTIVYNIIIYYADRLTQNNTNTNAIWDDGINTIKSIINTLPDEVEFKSPLTFTPFEQQFADYLSGVYVRVALQTESELGLCSIDDYVKEIKTLYITENGVYETAGYDRTDVYVQKTIDSIVEDEKISVQTTKDIEISTNEEVKIVGKALKFNNKNVALEEDLSTKQDTISDLETIREGASKGMTALQYQPVESKDITSTIAIPANKFVKLDTVSDNIVITLDTTTEIQDVMNEYHYKFTVSGTPTITFNDVIWINDIVPPCTDGASYEVSVVDGVALYVEYNIPVATAAMSMMIDEETVNNDTTITETEVQDDRE